MIFSSDKSFTVLYKVLMNKAKSSASANFDPTFTQNWSYIVNMEILRKNESETGNYKMQIISSKLLNPLNKNQTQVKLFTMKQNNT